VMLRALTSVVRAPDDADLDPGRAWARVSARLAWSLESH